MSTTPRISRDLDAAREAYDQVIVVSNSFLQLMACSTLCGRRKYRLIMPGCVLWKCIKFILSLENVVIAMSTTVWMLLCKASRFCDFYAPVHCSLTGSAGFVSGAAHGCLSLACLVGSGVCSLSQARPQVIPFCALSAYFGTIQGGRFVLVSAAGLGMIRGYDSFTTSDLCACFVTLRLMLPDSHSSQLFAILSPGASSRELGDQKLHRG
jgi:hypothetical protein